MTKVKICGINSEAAFDAAVEAGADWLAFNFFARSPRFVTAAEAARLSARHDGGPLRVGLFVAPAADDVAHVLDAVALDVLQIYAPEAELAALKARFRLPVWRAVGVSARGDLPDLPGVADGLLIEAKPPKDATRPGGNGVGFDWSLTQGWVAPLPWLLAGGLTPENVAAAVRISGAPAVDVSSGVESAPGVKDVVLIHDFVRAARAA